MMAIADTIRLGTAYSAKDAEFIAKQLHGVDVIRRGSGRRGLTSQDVVDTLKRPEFSQFLTLEKDNQLAEVCKMAEDLQDDNNPEPPPGPPPDLPEEQRQDFAARARRYAAVVSEFRQKKTG